MDGARHVRVGGGPVHGGVADAEEDVDAVSVVGNLVALAHPIKPVY